MEMRRAQAELERTDEFGRVYASAKAWCAACVIAGAPDLMRPTYMPLRVNRGATFFLALTDAGLDDLFCF